MRYIENQNNNFSTLSQKRLDISFFKLFLAYELFEHFAVYFNFCLDHSGLGARIH